MIAPKFRRARDNDLSKFAAGLICGRLPGFFVAGFRVAAGLDPRFRSAHRAFIAAATRRRAAALIVRFRGPFVSPLFGGRPRR